MASFRRQHPEEKQLDAKVTRPARPDILGTGFQESEVHRVKLEITNSVGRVTSMPVAEKRLRAGALVSKGITSRQRCEVLMTKHAKLKSFKNIPTIRWMIMGETEKPGVFSITMEDLTQGGKVHCISSVDLVNGNSPYSSCGKTIKLTNADEVSRQMALLAENATQDGVSLESSDIYFLLINKETGKGRVIVGDLGNVRFDDDYTDEDKNLYRWYLSQNKVKAAKFMKSMNDEILAPGCELDTSVMNQ